MKEGINSLSSTVFSRRWFAVFLTLILVLVLVPLTPGQEDDEEEFVQQGFERADANPKNASDPFELFRKGQIAHEKGDLDEALRLYTEAIESFSKFPEAEFQRGTIYQVRKEFDKAEESFRKAVEYRPDWTLAMSSLGSVLIANGKIDEAELVLEKAIRLDALSFGALTALTDLYMLRPPGEPKIKSLYTHLVYLTSKSRTPASIWACRASVERLLDQPAEAVKSIGRSLELDPGNRRALYEQVELFLVSSDYRGATEFASTLVRRFPDEVGAKILLARSLALNGKKDEALELLALIESPDATVEALVASIRASGDVDVKELEEQLRANPRNVEALGALCVSLRRTDPLKALRYCRQAFELDRDDLGHAVGYAAALVQLRNYGPAINLLEDLRTRVPDNYTVRANLATAYFQSAKYDSAKAEYKWITTRRPELPAGFYFLAITHDRLREYVDAMANYQRFLTISDAKEFRIEIERVKLRLPTLEKQVKRGQGRN